MARKASKEVSAKRHTAVPVATAKIVESPKKAATVTPSTPVVPSVVPTVKAEIKAPAASTEVKAAATDVKAVAAPASSTAIQPVAKVSDPAAVARLIAALRDIDADIARDAAIELGRLGNASAIQPLIEVLNNTDGYFNGVVRAAAAGSLANFRDERAFLPLLQAVSDPMAETSAEAVRALATIGDARAVGALIETVRNRDGFFLGTVRLAAVRGLIQLGGEQAKAELAYIANDGFEDAVIREAAAQSCTGAKGSSCCHGA